MIRKRLPSIRDMNIYAPSSLDGFEWYQGRTARDARNLLQMGKLSTLRLLFRGEVNPSGVEDLLGCLLDHDYEEELTWRWANELVGVDGIQGACGWSAATHVVEVKVR